MSGPTAHAKRERDGWRGQIIGEQGDVLTRPANLYPTADKAIAGVNRLWSFMQRRVHIVFSGEQA